MDDATAARVRELTWYHTLDLGGGVTTDGMFDHRPVRDRLGMPRDLSGRRCLDVGTMDGYLAFEMERRGAAEVHAIDVESPDDLDWPRSQRDRRFNSYDDQKPERFELARSELGSRVERHVLSVYELGSTLGHFDLVTCGDLLLHLRDPLRALESIRSCCDGRLALYTPIVRSSLLGRRRPVVELDGIDEFQWWLPSLPALVRMAEATGFTVERSGAFDLPVAGRPRGWRGRRGIIEAVPAP